MSELNFYGATGFINFVDGDRDAGAFKIYQFMGHHYAEVGQYIHHMKLSERLEMPLAQGPQLFWPIGRIPTDGIIGKD